MRKNKIVKIVIFSLLITSIGGVSAIASSNTYVKSKVDVLTSQFNSEKSKLEKKGNYKTDTEEAKKLKEKAIELDNLNNQVKTEADYNAQLKEFIEGCKAGLEDSKQDQKSDYSDKRQKFIDKMEKKINTIESEMKANETLNNSLKADSISDEKISTTSSSKKLLEKLLDRSDVDN